VLSLVREPVPCPRCRGDDVRPSRRARGPLARLLHLWRYRCRACRLVIFAWTRARAQGELQGP